MFKFTWAVIVFCIYTGRAAAQDSTAKVDTTTTIGTVTVHNTTDTLNRDTSSGATAGVLDSTTQSGETWYVTRTDSPAINPLMVYPIRNPADSDVLALRKEDDFWYVPVGPGKPKVNKEIPKRKEPWSPGPWFRFLLLSLIAGALVAALVVIIQSGSGEPWFKRNRRLKKQAAGKADPEPVHPDDPHRALQQAIDREDYASAVRFLFLITLAEMFERKLIFSAREKTNRVYLRELQGSPFYTDFARLVRHYDYTFYGGFSPDAATFGEIREQYEQYQNRLHSL